MKRPRKRLTVGLLMLLVAGVALMLWAVEYSRRTRVVFDNRSSSRVSDLVVSYAGQERHLGPVEPGGQFVIRVHAPPGEPVRIRWDVRDDAGRGVRRFEAPAVTLFDFGGDVRVGWDG